jgi:putative transposase
MMKESQFTEEQIITVLKEAEAGVNIQDLCRKHEISEATFYQWRLTHGGLKLSVATRLRQLEEENRRLRSLVADLTLSNQALKQVVEKKW